MGCFKICFFVGVIYDFSQYFYWVKILYNARTFVHVVQYLRDFGRFEMNKRDRILVAEKDVPHEIQERHFQRSFFNSRVG
jgi:hypothetical protein